MRTESSRRILIRLRAVSLFSCSVEQSARDTQMTTRVTEGARRERHSNYFLLGLPPSLLASRVSRLASRVSRLRRSTLECACTPLTRSEEKEGLLAVYILITSENY